jgi:hypothetical protein
MTKPLASWILSWDSIIIGRLQENDKFTGVYISIDKRDNEDR